MPLVLRIENVDTLPDGGPVFFEIDRRGIDIGRDTYLDWTLPDPERFISGKHCEIHYRDNGYFLHDVSTNGTTVNGKGGRVTEPYRLGHGDRIHIGHYIIIAELSGEEAGPDGPGVVPNKGGTSFGGDPWGGVSDTAPAVDKRDFAAHAARDSGPSAAPIDGDLAEENISWSVGEVTPGEASAADEVDWGAPVEPSPKPPADEVDWSVPAASSPPLASPPAGDGDFDWGAPVSSSKSDAAPPDWRAALATPEPAAADPEPEKPEPEAKPEAEATPEPTPEPPAVKEPEPAPPVAAEPEATPAPEAKPETPPAPAAADVPDWRASLAAVGEAVPDASAATEPVAAKPAAPEPVTPQPAAPEPVAEKPAEPTPVEPEPVSVAPEPAPAPEPEPMPRAEVMPNPVAPPERAAAPEPAAPGPAPTPAVEPIPEPAPAAGGGLAGQWAGGSQPEPAPAAVPAPAPAMGGSFIAAFERGAGMPEGAVAGRGDEAFAEELGVLFKTVTENLQAMLLARAETKSAMRSAERTMIGALENNPLKFSPTPEDALRVMFGQQTRSYLNAEQTVADSFGDLQKHQLQTFGAMQQALQALIDDLDPDNIADATSKDSGLASIVSSRRAKYWDTYVERFKSKAGRHERGMIDAFMILFAEMYDRQG